MLIVNNEQAYNDNQIFRYIPKKFRRLLYYVDFAGLEEIRLRQGRPAMLYYSDAAFFISAKGVLTQNPGQAVFVAKQDILEGMELICEASVYAVENEIRNGFITIGGGHRVGLTGTAVVARGRISNLKDISGLNYRVARDITGISDKLMDAVMPAGKIQNTLLISPPQCGKTTLLRDIIRNISHMGRKIGVADERSEIAAMTNGYPGYDLGFSCDVLEGAPKGQAMLMLLRSMSPEVIATDELGGTEDCEAVAKIMHAGVKIIATIHGDNRSELARRQDTRELLGHFDCFITLSRRNGAGTVEEIFHAV